MRKMIMPMFSLIYKKKEGKICLLFSLLPLMLIVTSLLPTNFMQLSADEGSLSLLEFFDAVEGVLFQMVIPTIAFLYLTVTCFGDEIKSGKIYIYKDIPRIKVFSAKIITLIMWYFVFVGMTFVFSCLTYIVYVDKQPYSSHLFLPVGADLTYILISIVGVWLSMLITVVLVAVVSLKANDGFALVVGILFSLFCVIAPDLKTINLFFPTGYKYMIEDLGAIHIFMIMILISGIYAVIELLVCRILIKRIEY